MKIELDGSKRNKGHVFLWRGGDLVAKFWFYGDGTVRYREWLEGPTNPHEITQGETEIFKPRSSKESANNENRT